MGAIGKESRMKRARTRRCAGAGATAAAIGALAGFAAVEAAAAGDIPSRTTAHTRLTHLEQYLMNTGAEVALARSAAPAAVSAQATILTLGPQGYQTAVNGTNGFTCLVERSWTAPFDNPEFWNPKIRAPVCYNPAASRSILPYTLRRTRLALAGRSQAQMLEELRAAVAHKEVAEPEPGAMSFMMSRDEYLGDAQGHWHSHLMFHVPRAAGASWGANLPGSPVVLDEAHREVPEPQTIFFVPVGRWSDGTPAPAL
jgi:hypothetical protein